MKIKLFCNAGMSTSMLVTKMRNSAKERNLDVEITAFPESKLEKETDDCDVALLGPQVKFLLGRAKKICDPKGIPVAAINIQDYGLMKGEKLLNMAMKMFEEK